MYNGVVFCLASLLLLLIAPLKKQGEKKEECFTTRNMKQEFKEGGKKVMFLRCIYGQLAM